MGILDRLGVGSKRAAEPFRYPLERTNERTFPPDFDDKVFVWDIDKTYLASDFESFKGLLSIPFEFAVDKRVIAGADVILRALRRGVDPGHEASQPLYFISASPVQMRGVIERKMTDDGVEYDGLFIFEENAYGFIPNECGAAFGLGQMDKIDQLWKLREERFNWHTEFLRKHEDKFVIPTIIPETETTWLCYPIQLRPETGWSRRKLQTQLEDSGIMSRVIFSGNITRHPMLDGHEYRVDDAGLGNCDTIMEQGIMLPCHPTMSREEVEAFLRQVYDDQRQRGAKGELEIICDLEEVTYVFDGDRFLNRRGSIQQRPPVTNRLPIR